MYTIHSWSRICHTLSSLTAISEAGHKLYLQAPETSRYCSSLKSRSPFLCPQSENSTGLHLKRVLKAMMSPSAMGDICVCFTLGFLLRFR